MDNKPTFIISDSGIAINPNFIRWIKQVDNCMEICTRFDGCMVGTNTIQVCENVNKINFDKIHSDFFPK